MSFSVGEPELRVGGRGFVVVSHFDEEWEQR